MEEITSAIHLRTTNDRNGNPRRAFVGLNASGHVVIVTDEGYAGRPSWVRDLNKRGVWEYTVETTITGYKDALRQGARLENK